MAPVTPKYPSGYRFIPKDWQLIYHYLAKKIAGVALPSNHILEVEIYDYSPDDIFKNHKLSEDKEWYFFSSRTKKYPKGTQPQRKAGVGFWKAQGSEKKICDENGIVIGCKRNLTYFEGTQKCNNKKTNWAMTEYKIKHNDPPKTSDKDMLLDKWVLYKIYRIKRSSKTAQNNQANNVSPVVQNGEQELKVADPPVNNQGRVYRDMMLDEEMKHHQVAPSTSHGDFIPQLYPQPRYNDQINPFDLMKLNRMDSEPSSSTGSN